MRWGVSTAFLLAPAARRVFYFGELKMDFVGRKREIAEMIPVCFNTGAQIGPCLRGW
jgi:hypothetical protein